MPLLSSNVVYKDSLIVPSVSDDSPVVIEGVDVYDIVCPPSRMTGNRTNPLTLLSMALPDKDNRFIGQLLSEVPSIASDSSLTDQQRIDTLAMRLATGTPSENEVFSSQLMKVADVLFPDKSSDSVPSDSINFDSQDVPDSPT